MIKSLRPSTLNGVVDFFQYNLMLEVGWEFLGGKPSDILTSFCRANTLLASPCVQMAELSCH